MSYYYHIQNGQMQATFHAPSGSKSFVRIAGELLPPQISQLHEQFQAWGAMGLSPGPVLGHRIWLGPQNELCFHFPGNDEPAPLDAVGLAPHLAAWLVLLDKWMETFVVIARARAVWTPLELASALCFTCPPFLPPQLMREPPDNWARVAHALAVAVADAPLAGAPQDRHWQNEP
jgi:hypothetical protein